MERIIISKKEYAELVDAKRKVADLERTGRRRFIASAFGVLKDDFGKESSVAYVKKLRKQ